VVTQRKDWINSMALYLGGEAPLGPVFLGYGCSSSGSAVRPRLSS